MKAIILAAGQKNEISSITGDIPKALIDINGSSILEIQLNVLHSVGIDDVSVVIGYKKELIDIPGVKYYENDCYNDTNILYSMFAAEKELSGDVLILYGDVVIDRECLERLLENESDISIGVSVNLNQYKEEIIQDLEIVAFDANSEAVEISKNFSDLEFSTYGQYTGIMKCTAKGIEIIKANYSYFKIYNNKYKDAYLSDLLDNIIKLGIMISCVIVKKGWVKINSVKDYNRLIQKEADTPQILKMSTDWAVRSTMYNNIKWVNEDRPLELMVEMCGFSESSPNILDIGTGTGKVLTTFKEKYPRCAGYGIDISSDMMGKIDKSFGFDLRVGNAEDLSVYENDFFDIVTARMSMHHIDHTGTALLQIKKKLKKDGCVIICEGNPPNKETLEFYKEVFSYKEKRNVFLADDLINMLLAAGYKDVTTKTVIVKDMSLNNWIMNSGIPLRNKEIIVDLHFNCEDYIKKAYNMKFVEDDILMEWKFTIVKGVK